MWNERVESFRNAHRRLSRQTKVITFPNFSFLHALSARSRKHFRELNEDIMRPSYRDKRHQKETIRQDLDERESPKSLFARAESDRSSRSLRTKRRFKVNWVSEKLVLATFPRYQSSRTELRSSRQLWNCEPRKRAASKKVSWDLTARLWK